MIPVQDPNGPVRATCERSDATAGFERQGTVTTPDGPAVYMVQTRQAFKADAVPGHFHRGDVKRARALDAPHVKR